MKNEIQDMEYKVRIFMASYRQYIPDHSQASNKLRARLITEEYLEFAARREYDELALDGICDLLYVLLGTRVHYSRGEFNLSSINTCEPLNVTIGKVRDLLQEPIVHPLFPIVLNDAIGQVYSIGAEFADVPGAFNAVHNNNMEKFWTAKEISELKDSDWTVTPHLSNRHLFIVADKGGKVIKPPAHRAPSLLPFLKG